MLIDGKETAASIKDELKAYVENNNIKAKLAIVQVGDNTASNVYVKNKIKACEYCGVDYVLCKLPDTLSESQLLSEVERLNNDSMVNGIIVQLPLPDKYNEYNIINHIKPFKDVDGFTAVNLGKLMSSDETGMVPATPLGICNLIKQYNIETQNKNILIIGRSNTVGRPLANLLSNKQFNGNVLLAHSRTDKNKLIKYGKSADIIIACCGQMKYINSEFIDKNKKTVIIDVGIHRDENGKLCGDVDFEDVKDYCDITPVPGGVGPMTVVSLIQNTIKSAISNKH